MNYSKHVVKFNLFNAFRNRYPIDNFEFIETNMRPWGAVQDKSDSFILKNDIELELMPKVSLNLCLKILHVSIRI